MPPDADDKALIAKVSLYQGLSKANRLASTYLRRNLTQVLDCYDRQHFLERSNAPPKEGATTNTAKTCNHRSGWAFPELSEDMVKDLIRGSTPTLSITALSLRLTSPSPVAAKIARLHAAGDPDWVPRPNELRLACQVTVAIYELRSNRRQIYLDLRPGTLIERRSGPATQGFEIALDQPFRIEENRLFAVAPAHADKAPWKREMISNTGLDIGIQFLRSEDTAEFLNKIEGRHAADSIHVTGSEGVLRASWTKLPELPAPGDILPLKRAKGTKNLDLSYGVKLKMGWNKQRSVLTSFNQTVQHARNEPRQLPTPSSEDMDEPKPPCTIKYLFASQFRMRSAVTNDLKCLLCPNSGKHSSFERLRLHFLTHHGHLQFKVNESGEDDDRLVVTISAEDVKEIKQSQDERSWDWEAPAKAFDIAAHLNGNCVWNPETVSEKGTTKAATARYRGKSSKEAPDQATELLAVPRAKRKILPPDEVEDLPDPKRTRHEVPDLPGINFYRTTSKQKVIPGTLLGESDEEPDDSWFEQATRSQLVGLGLDKISQDFHEVFNKHLDVENPMSDTLSRDAVIRFARKFRSKLSEPRWRDRFETKLKQLKNQGVVGEDTLEYCKKLLGVTETHEETTETEGVIPESPAAQIRSRLKDAEPFGRRIIICTRPGKSKSSEEVETSELLKDDIKASVPAKSNDEIQPSDLEWAKFLRILDDELVYNRGADNIVCISDGTRRPVVDEADWIDALVQVQEETTGPIRFELCPMDFVEKGYETMDSQRSPERKKKDKGKQPSREYQVPPLQRPLKKAKSCVCGKVVEGVRRTIACANRACGKEFHMPCVQLQKRTMDWQCAGCSSR